jgi:hypothetical protein
VVNHTFDEAKQMGRKLAQVGLEALTSAETTINPELSLTTKEISTKLTNILFKLAFRRKLLPDARDQHGRVSTEVNLLKIGPLWLACVPGEMLPKLGLALKDSMRQAGASVVGVIGLANDEPSTHSTQGAIMRRPCQLEARLDHWWWKPYNLCCNKVSG